MNLAVYKDAQVELEFLFGVSIPIDYHPRKDPPTMMMSFGSAEMVGDLLLALTKPFQREELNRHHV